MTAEQYAQRFQALLRKTSATQASLASHEDIDAGWTTSCLTSSLDLVDGVEINEGMSLEEYELWRQASDAAEQVASPEILDWLSFAPSFAPTIGEQVAQPAAADTQALEDAPCSRSCGNWDS